MEPPQPPVRSADYAVYGNKTGSYMATALTAGVGALVLSVLGSGSGNYFQGAKAKRIIVDSADILRDLAQVPQPGPGRSTRSAGSCRLVCLPDRVLMCAYPFTRLCA